MANKENINKLIARLEADTGSHFRMDTFCEYIPGTELPEDCSSRQEPTRYIECKTAFCIAGWSNLIRMEETGVKFKDRVGEGFECQFSSEWAALRWLGFGPEDPDSDEISQDLFYMDNVSTTSKYGFDSLPDDVRKRAGIRVLEILRDTDKVDWDQALRDAGALPDPENTISEA
jgi:hypothetical protein